ncbi:MAG: hypothetical protein ABW168_16150 [Sedimenticola sp.]
MTSCFIIMPITGDPDLVEKNYQNDEDHFKHILEYLFIPAVINAGYEPIKPNMVGADIIQGEIIKQLSEADLVLCDMSTLNPNVFYEHGIRTALDKPVALVSDEKTKYSLPFDTAIINYQEYKSDALKVWNIDSELEKLTNHIQASAKSSAGRNTLWKYFGITTPVKNFNPKDATTDDKIDMLVAEVSIMRNELGRIHKNQATVYQYGNQITDKSIDPFCKMKSSTRVAKESKNPHR